jgi:hypothetical protein
MGDYIMKYESTYRIACAESPKCRAVHILSAIENIFIKYSTACVLLVQYDFNSLIDFSE